MEFKEQKRQVLRRVPPGDRWVFFREPSVETSWEDQKTYASLTDALEGWYQQHGDTKFYIDAREGTVSIVYSEPIESTADKKFSIYGED